MEVDSPITSPFFQKMQNNKALSVASLFSPLSSFVYSSGAILRPIERRILHKTQKVW